MKSNGGQSVCPTIIISISIVSRRVEKPSWLRSLLDRFNRSNFTTKKRRWALAKIYFYKLNTAKKPQREGESQSVSVSSRRPKLQSRFSRFENRRIGVAAKWNESEIESEKRRGNEMGDFSFIVAKVKSSLLMVWRHKSQKKCIFCGPSLLETSFLCSLALL